MPSPTPTDAIIPGPVPPAPRSWGVLLDRSRAVSVAIFVLTVVVIAALSFAELNSPNVPVRPGRVAELRVTAGTTFTYESEIETASARARLLTTVPPVYRLETAHLQRFEAHVRELLDDLDLYAANPERKRSPADLADLERVAQRFNLKGPYRASTADIAALLALGDREDRRATLEHVLGFLREIHAGGVLPESASAESGGLNLIQVQRADGNIAPIRVQTVGEALTYLRVNIVADAPERSVGLALFRLMRDGVVPNLAFDAVGSERLRERALRNFRPISVTVERGQVLVEPGAVVTPTQYEMLLAYRAHLAATGGVGGDDARPLFGRVILVLAMVLASVVFLRIEDRDTLRSNLRLGLLATIVVLNLALVRLSFGLAALPYFLDNFRAAELLPLIAPTALAPLVVAILLNAGSAIFTALLVSIFTSVIYGQRLDLLVITFLASLAGIYYVREVRRRSRVVKAGAVSGLVVALFAIAIGLSEQTPAALMLWQVGAGAATGAVTGVLVAGLLPVLESLFRRTTDITLLELTDYNHPLLRVMQVRAPGTYHHSLIVAQLSENAAAAIGANPLLCRVCALFHDIGKTSAPEVFTENQGSGPNLHDQLSPEDSARRIKQHVTRGVELAREHHLPEPLIDVIHQHHGTTRVEVFFQKARRLRPSENESSLDALYRYAGPKPQFRESAIISLADPVEAAVRSLKEADEERVRTLIERIVQGRITAGELDEAPLTLDELARIKTSFTMTLLGMLHSRVAYPPAVATPPAATGMPARL